MSIKTDEINIPPQNLSASCKAAARLMSESRDRPLREQEKTDLELHWRECQNCVRFNAQLNWLSALAKRYAEGDAP